jgi:hypothetical protein
MEEIVEGKLVGSITYYIEGYYIFVEILCPLQQLIGNPGHSDLALTVHVFLSYLYMLKLLDTAHTGCGLN